MERRQLKRQSHRIPAVLHAGKDSDSITQWKAELKDMSAAALCLVLSAESAALLRQAARVEIRFEMTDGAPIEVKGTVLYTLVIQDRSRLCVILFDDIREDLVDTIPAHKSVEVWV